MVKTKELNEIDIDGILILSGVGTFFLILNSLFFVNNIPSGGYGYGILYLVMKYFAPLMMLAVFISSIYGKIKQYKINRKIYK